LACNKTDGTTITTDIQTKMFAEPQLKSASVDVSTKDGIVTLSGQVPHEAARVAARNIASQIFRGKGAAIGAGVGAGGGTAVQAMTKGQQVKIPSETRLDFTLHAPVAVTYVPHQKATRAAPASTDSSQPANPSTPQ